MGIAVTAMNPPGRVMNPAGNDSSCAGVSMARSRPDSLRVVREVRMSWAVRSGSKSRGENALAVAACITS